MNRGLAWVGLASSFVALFDVVSLILILKFWVPAAQYGVVTVVLTLFGALELAAELGLSAAVVYRDDHTPARLSTVFWLNIGFGLAVYGCVYLAAPLLARLHGHAVIKDIFRVYGLTLLLRAGYSLHQALMKKQLRFKELSAIRVVANTADFGVKIYTAATGHGLWCFVWGGLARSLVFAVATPLCQRFRPRLIFRVREAAPYLRFGVRASGGELLFQIYSNLDYQIVNIYFGAAALGAYRAAYELVLEPVKFLSGVVVGVAFPAFSRLKHDLESVRAQYLAFIRQNLVVVLSMVAVIMLVAGELLATAFRPEYAAAATAARLLAVVGLLRGLSNIGPPLLDGLGRPDLTLRYQVTAAAVLAVLFWLFAELLGPSLGFVAVAAAWAVGYPVAFATQMIMVFAVTALDPGRYFRAVGRIAGCVAVAGLAGLAARWLTAGAIPVVRLLVVAGVTGALTALSLSVFAGISPRVVIAGLRSEPPPPL